MGVLEPHGRGRRVFRADGLSPLSAPCPRPEREYSGEGPTPPVIIVHSLAHAIGALTGAARAGRSIILMSAAEAGIYAGPGWFRALVEAAREAVPGARFVAMLDCGEEAGAALATIRAQIEGVIFIGRGDVARRLGDIARQHDVRLETTRPVAALDLGADFFASAERIEQRCAEALVA